MQYDGAAGEEGQINLFALQIDARNGGELLSLQLQSRQGAGGLLAPQFVRK